MTISSIKSNRQSELSNLNKQRGMTLVVVLVILTAMTFLGLGAMSDGNMQLNMVRNAQFQTLLHSAAKSEINAQIDLINAPGTGLNDPLITEVIDAPLEDDDGDGTFERLVEEDDTDSDALDLLAANITTEAAATDLVHNLSVKQINPLINYPADGYSTGGDVTFKFRHFEIRNGVEVAGNSAYSSSQTQGIKYLGAN